MKTAMLKLALDDKTKERMTAVAALPVAGALAGGALLGVAPAAGTLGARVARGARWGGSIGAGAAGLIGLGALLEKADPTGRTLKTMVELAPAVATTAAAVAEMNASERNKSAAARKFAMTLAELEEETRRSGRAAGAKWGRRRGAISGSLSSLGPGALAGASAGGFLGGGSPKARLGKAALGALLGGSTGGALGGTTGARKGKRIGEALGVRAAEEQNLRRRQQIVEAIRSSQGQDKTSAAMSKEAIGLWGASKGLVGAMRTGWSGKGAASKVLTGTGATQGQGISGLSGAVYQGGRYMGALMQRQPLMATGMMAAPVLGAGYALGR
jgi:hypothetical protein